MTLALLLNDRLSPDEVVELMRYKAETMRLLADQIISNMEKLPTPGQRVDYAMAVLPLYMQMLF